MSYYSPNKTPNTGYQNKNAVCLQELITLPDNKFIQEETYVDDAMNCFGNMKSTITSSKLRSLYSMLCDIVTNESNRQDEKISDACLAALRLLRVHMIYDMGRDSAVMMFVEKTHILAYLVYVEKCRKHSDFTLFCKYFEALIAFHRFMNPNGN